MHAAVEPHAEDTDAAFARRAARGQHCWRTAIRLRRANFADSCPHISSHGSLPETNADRRATIEMAIVPIFKKCSKQGPTGMIALVDVKTYRHRGSGWTISGSFDRRRQSGRFRRIPVAAVHPAECPLTEPTAAARLSRQRRGHEAKSAVARPEELKFLGLSISNDGSERRIAQKALGKCKAQI
jgi:hypothetical protein